MRDFAAHPQAAEKENVFEQHAIEALADFVANYPKNTLPQDVREAVSLLVTDLMAAAAAGLNAPLSIAAREAATAMYGEGPVAVWLTGLKLSVAGAAIANSAAASALDIDDGHRGAAGHPGAGIIPAALAVGQAAGASDGDIFDAIALGYDVALRVATARPVATLDAYCSGLWVGYGVAAAAGRLLGLNARQLAHALAIAGAEGPIMFASGASKYQGSTVKEGIPAAVSAGLTGAYRARGGATGPIDLLDNHERFQRDILTGQLGEVWWIQQCYTKPYACCRYMHSAIDAIAVMRRPGKPVKSLRIETFARSLKLANARNPENLEAGQYSFYFSCALAALYGPQALQPVDPARLTDPDTLELAGRIELVAHEDFSKSFPKATPCRVLMDQGDGVESLTIWHPLGDVANPMSRDQINEKFLRISSVSLDRDRQDGIIAVLDALQVCGFAQLFNALSNTSTAKTSATNDGTDLYTRKIC